MPSYNPAFHFHPEVATALAQDQPIVALESTLITHGLPKTDSLPVARALEDIIRARGVVPATIAILAGRIHIGLTADQLTCLANASQVRKCSVRDLPLMRLRGEYGSTTVAATMRLAHLAGIRVFATGGIGGVHRHNFWDVSADLMQLAQIPLTVVCAGIKGFLDIQATLEVLETHAVPILGYQTDYLPAFYSRHSPYPIDMRVDNVAQIAQIMHEREALQQQNALLVTTPVPTADEWPYETAQTTIEQALQLAEQQQLRGQAITPFLLDHISQLSYGQSKKANIALLQQNAALAADIALAYQAQ